MNSFWSKFWFNVLDIGMLVFMFSAMTIALIIMSSTGVEILSAESIIESFKMPPTKVDIVLCCLLVFGVLFAAIISKNKK